MAIEALTYERATSYADEIPPSEIETWQPKKLMEILIEIEPHADKSSSITAGREKTYGVPGDEMTFLGAERVFSLSSIKKHYDALGSYLHIPSMRQAGMPFDTSKVRRRCAEIYIELEEALASKIFNVNFGVFARVDCADCGKPIRKRIPAGAVDVVAECSNCSASYLVLPIDDKRVDFKPILELVKCPTPACTREIQIWKKDIKAGTFWTCAGCAKKFQIRLGVTVVD